MKHDVYCERTKRSNDCRCGSRAYALDPYPSVGEQELARIITTPYGTRTEVTPWIEFTSKLLKPGGYRGVHRS